MNQENKRRPHREIPMLPSARCRGPTTFWNNSATTRRSNNALPSGRSGYVGVELGRKFRARRRCSARSPRTSPSRPGFPAGTRLLAERDVATEMKEVAAHATLLRDAGREGDGR